MISPTPALVRSLCWELMEMQVKHAAPAGAPARGLMRALADFVHRQYYGLTGRMLGGSRLGTEAAAALRRRVGVGTEHALSELTKAHAAGRPREVSRALAALEAERGGLTHVPGLFRGLATEPARTLRLSWKSLRPAEKVLTASYVGVPLAERAIGREPRPGDTRSERQRLAEDLAASGVFLASGPVPIVPSVLAAAGVGRVAREIAAATEHKKG